MSAFFPILFGLLTIAFVGYCWWYFSPKQKGKRGEAKVHEILSQLPEEYIIMDDVVLPTNKGTTQIDHIVVSKYGIFAIETKNYRGDIYGDDDRYKWTQIIATDITFRKNWWKTYTYINKNHFYNPVKQAVGHVYRMKEHLKEWPNLRVIPIVVFTAKADISKVTTRNHVICDFDLLSTIKSYITPYINDEDVNKIAGLLSQKNVRDIVDDKTHARNVKAVALEIDRKITSGICPRCGGRLIERNGKYGSFLGCSNYPNCKFTSPL
ncbi:MAG: NERD domain-containing protein [Prevotella sp.]|nr:NERD domain-containing protein [Prevotella sp.]